MKEFDIKKIEAEELAKALKNLSEEERTKIFFMIKGIELISQSTKKEAS